MEQTEIFEFIYEAIDEVNSQQADPRKQIEKSPDSVLIGPGAGLDSLGLVNFIVALEGVISDKLDVEIALADERAMMQETSPFRTVASLAGYIEMQLKEQH